MFSTWSSGKHRGCVGSGFFFFFFFFFKERPIKVAPSVKSAIAERRLESLASRSTAFGLTDREGGWLSDMLLLPRTDLRSPVIINAQILYRRVSCLSHWSSLTSWAARSNQLREEEKTMDWMFLVVVVAETQTTFELCLDVHGFMQADLMSSSQIDSLVTIYLQPWAAVSRVVGQPCIAWSSPRAC